MGARLTAWLAVALLLGARSSRATDGFVVDDFEPAALGSSWFSVQSRLPPAPFAIDAGLVLDHAIHPITVYDSRSEHVVEFIDHQLFARLGAGIRFAKRYAVNVSMPILLSTHGESIRMGDHYFDAPRGQDVGDLRLELTFLLPRLSHSFDLFAGARLWLPTGNHHKFAGDGGVRVAPQVGLAGSGGMFAYALRATLEGHFRDNDFAGHNWGTRLQVGGAFGIETDRRRLTIGPEVYASTEVGSDFLVGAVTRAEALFGAHYFLQERWRFGLGCGFGLSTGIGTPDARLLAMFSWNLLREPRPVPPPPRAQSSDAPAVALAKEPTAPPPPPPAEPPDSDRDGVPDPSDACPQIPGITSTDPRLNGCPAVGDQDDDGIVDSADACLTVPGVATGDPARNGCPAIAAVVDLDSDGILDTDDACPDRPGTASSEPSAHGCPQAKLVGARIEILGRIEFETRSSELRPESEPTLRAVLQVLQNQPTILRLSVDGHTDNRGAPAHNEQLSLRRAEAVIYWLVTQGIDATRLVARGFGSKKPIDGNDSEQGRRNNRRVEFNVVEFSKPSGGAP